ncbi:Hypothetical protein EIN_082610, partial [Entamoeba invadens IP1]
MAETENERTLDQASKEAVDQVVNIPAAQRTQVESLFYD